MGNSILHRNINRVSYSEIPIGTRSIKARTFLNGIHSMQGWTATTRHEVTRKRSTKIIKHPGNLFRMNLQLKGVS